MLATILLGVILLLLLVFGSAHAFAAYEDAMFTRELRDYIKERLLDIDIEV